jgi:hypothetical protein
VTEISRYARKYLRMNRREWKRRWLSRAVLCLNSYLWDKPVGAVFVSADLVVYAHRMKLPHPKDNRSWGPVIQKFVDYGLICRAGYVKAFWRKGAMTTLWMKC